MADFVADLVKKVLMSAASAGGSKIGTMAVSFALDLFGLSNNDLDEVKTMLNTISAQVQKTDSEVSQLIDEVKWNKATDSFDSICAATCREKRRQSGQRRLFRPCGLLFPPN